MNDNHHDTSAPAGSGMRDEVKKGKSPARTLTRLSAAEIARRTQRQRPGIARAAATPAAPNDEMTAAARRQRATQPHASAGQETGSPLDQYATTRSAEPSEVEAESAGDSEPAGDSRPSLVAPRADVGPRQMTVWEDATDEDVIAGWVAATTRADNFEPDGPGTGDKDGDESTGDRWRVVPVVAAVDRDSRRANLRDVATRDDPHLIQQVRPAIIDLVVEHRYVSAETDRRLTALGIRFGVWRLAKASDREFDPFRDLTEDRIAGFVRSTGRHLTDGSRDTYAAALRRLAAGPTIRHTGKRRKAVPPLPPRVEDGLWAAADAFTPTSWQHQETKTLLSLTFGAGAMPAEINLAAPEDVLVDASAAGIRVTVRLTRSKAWVRDVPVLDERYAHWLAARSAQLSGHTYLFKPDRTDRRNAINATTRSLAGQNSAFERFELNAARNAWAVAALNAGVPFAEWANAAGVGPGTHLPTDLLAYLPTPSPAQVEAAFRQAAPHVHREAHRGG